MNKNIGKKSIIANRTYKTIINIIYKILISNKIKIRFNIMHCIKINKTFFIEFRISNINFKKILKQISQIIVLTLVKLFNICKTNDSVLNWV